MNKEWFNFHPGQIVEWREMSVDVPAQYMVLYAERDQSIVCVKRYRYHEGAKPHIITLNGYSLQPSAIKTFID